MKQSQKYSHRQLMMLKGVRNSLPFILCLFVSAGLWFTRELGKTYTENIDVRVTYSNSPKSQTLVSQVPSTIRYTVEGPGWGLLKHYIFKDNVQIDLSEIAQKAVQTVSTEDEMFTNLFGEHLKIQTANPESIDFVFEDIHSKKVPVRVPLKLSYEQQYELSDPVSLSPDSVFVYGSSSLIDTMTYVKTVALEKHKISESFSVVLPLIVSNDITTSVDEVTVEAHVEKFTEQSIELPIRLINVPEAERLVLDMMHNTVSLSFLIGISKVQTCFPTDFEVVADYQKQMSNGMIPVEIVRSPDYVRIVHQDISSVSVILDYIQE